ncbi:MAG: DUF192 domain-containing protein [Planctomycetota bacterium]
MADRLKRLRVGGVLGWVCGLTLVLAGCADKPEGADEGVLRTDFEQITIAEQPFDLELAVTPVDRYQGLSGRESIPENGGMLFVFPRTAVREFVMRDCVIPIDIIFVRDDGHVVATHAMQVEPLATRSNPTRRYGSGEPVRYAIELRGGRVAELGVTIGDRIELPTASLKARAR